MIARVDFSIKRGVTNPVTFVPVGSDGQPLPTAHLEKADLNIRPMYGLPIKIPLVIGAKGLTAVLQIEQTRDLQWRCARYEVKVAVRGVVQVIFEGNLTLESDLGV